MNLQGYFEKILPVIETELQETLKNDIDPNLDGMYAMLAYHMGWEGQGAGAEASGKRIRPMLLLLCTMAAGGDWQKALPGAAAVELVHNFSLVHDDIEDNSPTRRGRPTVWAIWGIPQAINTGDALFSLAQISVLRLTKTVSWEAGLSASQALHKTCLRLTQGQHLDLAYEQREDVSLKDYWTMVKGKTGALLSASAYIGSVAAQTDSKTSDHYRDFGELLGLAFQAQDDLLGIWGDAALTGKSTHSDLMSGKKSLPVIFGLNNHQRFATRWKEGHIQAHELQDLADELEHEGALDYVCSEVDRLTKQALDGLALASPIGDAGDALIELADLLVKRKH